MSRAADIRVSKTAPQNCDRVPTVTLSRLGLLGDGPSREDAFSSERPLPLNALPIGLVVFVCILGAFGLGFALNAKLPTHHLSARSRDSVTQMVVMLSTMTALVLGLMISSAKNSFDAKSSGIAEVATDIILLDREMASYGRESAAARALLRTAAEKGVAALWPKEGFQRSGLEHLDGGGAELAGVQAFLRGLTPRNDFQREVQSRALGLSVDLARALWVIQFRKAGSLPAPFLGILISWLVIIFASMGALAPRNATVLMVAIATSFALAAGVFLIEELDTPHGGVIRISEAPLRLVIQHLGE